MAAGGRLGAAGGSVRRGAGRRAYSFTDYGGAPHLLDLQVGCGGAALDAVGGHGVGRADEAEHRRLVAHLAPQVAQGLPW